MSPNIVYQLVELAINVAQCELDSGDVEKALLAVIKKGMEAYEDHTGEPVNPFLLNVQTPLEAGDDYTG
jgi:hypothetical protein